MPAQPTLLVPSPFYVIEGSTPFYDIEGRGTGESKIEWSNYCLQTEYFLFSWRTVGQKSIIQTIVSKVLY